MPLLYTDDQRAIVAQARRALEASVELPSLLGLIDRQGVYHTGYWDLARAQGWTAAALPKAHGGVGLGLVELGLIAFETGRVLAGAPFLTSSFGVARALMRCGGDAAAHWLPGLARGDRIGAVALAEEQDVLGTRAAFVDGRVSGLKQGVSGGLYADVALALADDRGEPVLLLVPLADVARVAAVGFDNSRCSATLHFDRAPATPLARGGAALDAARDVLAAQAVVTAHEQAGGAEALMERARDYALRRRAFGQPIGAFQSVKHRIAELYVAVEMARAAALSAAASDGQGDFLAAAAAARIQATEAYDSAARDATQIHGGMGVTWESGLHLHMRRARTLGLEQGNMLYWEDVLVDQLEAVAA